MLVLTRELGQSIRISDDIVVKVVRLNNKHVRLGIEAPRSMPVVRTELDDIDKSVVAAEAASVKS
jgi:carbon storage regulator